MARAAVKAKQQARAKAQPAKPARGGRRRGGSGGDPNQQLFFMRLRRGQKWLYAALAAVFAATFVGVGVGSGAGNSLGQLYTGLFGGGGDAVGTAKAEIKNNPVKGYRDLATAYEAKGDTAGAIQALQSYVGLKKKDAAAWAELAGLELTQGQQYTGQYQQAQQAAQLSAPSLAFQPVGTFGLALGTNPVDQYNSQQVSSQTSQLYTQAAGAYSAALADYQKAALLQPHSADAQFQVATAAEYSGQYPVAVAALKRYLQMSPHSPQRAQVEHAIKQLEKAIKAASPPKPKKK
jgi:tetratricopeptide (TPR) repeat protein